MSVFDQIKSGLADANMMPDTAFMNDMREILERKRPGTPHARGPLTETGAIDKVKDVLGERNAIRLLRRKYPGAGVIQIARRGIHGAPVLDGLLRTADGRFIIIEAKWSDKGKPSLGRINGRQFVNDGMGWKEVKLPKSIKQMSPAWVEAKIRELRGKGGRNRRLAAELDRAYRAGRVVPYLVTTDDVGEVRKYQNLLDTDDWSDYKKAVEQAEAADKARGVKKDAPVSHRALDSKGLSKKSSRPKAPPTPSAPSPPSGKTQASTPPRKPSKISRAAGKLKSTAGRAVSATARNVHLFRLGFGADLLLGIAVDLMLKILEGKLERVNRQQMAAHYKSNVFNGMLTSTGKTLGWEAMETVRQIQMKGEPYLAAMKESGYSPAKDYFYFEYQYETIMERQAFDFSDAVVCLIRRLQFVEVFHDLVPIGKVQAYVSRKPVKNVLKRSKRRRTGNLFRYLYTHHMLVFDPNAYKHYINIWNHRMQANKAIRAVRERLGQADAEEQRAEFERVRKDLNTYEFLSAYAHLPSSARSKTIVSGLLAADKLCHQVLSWPGDKEALLVLWLGANPFKTKRQPTYLGGSRRPRKPGPQHDHPLPVERAEASYPAIGSPRYK